VLSPDVELTLYRGRKPGEPTVLALATSGRQPALRSVERLEHECALAPELDPAWAVRPLALTRQDGRPMLLLEDQGGEPLDRILDGARGRPLDLTGVLRLASDLAAALGQVHRKGLVHKDLKPSHVVVDAEGRVRLTGFGIASRLRSERQTLGPPDLIAGTLTYMAPEQTGRMNRSIDARSDLYSLGVILFEMLTGTLPFTATDPLELIHCHLARQPSRPSERVQGLPGTVDAIVLKLLAKNPEDRYRTASGVEADLRRCLAKWVERGKIDPFELGAYDASDRLLMPEKLYGRDAEIEALRAAFERVVTRGTMELILVSGHAGIGKSSIVNELHRDLVPRRGLFAAGKFDQYKRGIPYATLAQAFRSLVRQLLGKSNAELARWREALTAALDPYGQLMVNLIPELALVIGEQPAVPATDPQSSHARFHRVFRGLVGVFATAEHPLVLFIDDLQWLDSGTLELLERLNTDPELRHILLIGAYRNDEVGPTHPLARTLATIAGSGVAISELRLGPLHVGHLAQLAADALDADVRRTLPLAELVGEKTAGNPFFAIQFITALADEGLLSFDAAGSRWTWDVGRIRAKGITENVAQLLSAKLSRLSDGTRAAMGQLACLGNAADARTIALLRGDSQDDVHAILREAVEAGLILHVNGTFAFMHDRVHEAAYALIPPAERPMAHLRIGRVMLSLTPPAELEEKLFEIVDQFDRGVSAIDIRAEREIVAELNLIAGQRAMTSSAHTSARAFFAAGAELLGEEGWKDRYRLTFDLELHRAECEIVGGEWAAAEDRLAALSRRAAELTDQADVVCLTVLLYFSTGRNDRAVEVSLGFLPRVGITWSPRPSEEEVRREYLAMRRNLEAHPVETLRDRPAMSDPISLVVMAVLMELFPAAYAVDRYLMELVLLRMTNLSLEQGNCDSSSVAYAGLNMALGSHFADYTTAYSLGRLACEMVEQRGADRYRGRVYSCFAAFTLPWSKHLPLCRPLMTHAFEVGSSMGDMAFAAYDSRNLITHLLVSGVPLGQVQREAEHAAEFAGRIQLGIETERFFSQLGLVQRLRGVTREYPLEDEEWARQDVEGQPGLAMMVCYYWVFRLQERFLVGDLPAALEAASRVAGIRWAMRSSIEEAEYDLYAALTHAAVSDHATAEQRREHLQALREHYERIVVWAEGCPENFADRRALVGAEIARLEGRELEAQARFEEAVHLAREHGFVQNEGVANELAGHFHAARGLETIADAYLRNARDCYERWGAVGKVRQLDARYPQLRASRSPGALTSIDAPIAHLDVEVVDKASQTLSSEMVLPSLLEKLMRLAVEHAGAERGLLILLHRDEPYIEAEATIGRGRVEVAVRSARVESMDLPTSALQFVLRTRERVVLDDASVEGLDPQDEYVRRNCPRSVLCLPIFKETKVIGALYLENNLTPHAFTADRVAVLDFLGSQAAIWLENARLYSDLRRSEAWLREAQHLSSTGSWYWRVDRDTLEFSEQACRIFELDPSRTVTIDTIVSRIHPEDLPIQQEIIDIGRGPATDLDSLFRARMPDGSIKHLHLVAHGTRGNDGQVEYVGAVQDVTQRHLAEEALSRARSELAHMTRVTTLGALAASIAHEVSQPLSGIVTNSSTCLRMLGAEPPNVEGAKETVRRTIRDGHRASEVITRLRALFGNKGSVDEPVDLNDAAREVIALSWNELQRSRIVPRTELAADLPPVRGDRVQLQQVILNLILNAADAMSGVEDHARQLVVRTEVEEGGEQVRLSVQDAGVGLEVENVERLFEAFYTTKSDGMGMGLSVSRSIIEGHHGRLRAEPNEGPGATFSFSIPRTSEDTMPAHVQRSVLSPDEHAARSL
jgi:predicted ATPase/signal transduction histidine kinase